MTVIRTAYEALPSIVHAQVEELTGPVRHVTAASSGLNSAVAATLHTNGGAFFIKALPADARWVWTQQREAGIAPYVRTVSANFTGRIVAAGWDVLLFSALEAHHHADYTPGSADLAATAALLSELGALPCPAIELKHADQRLAAYVERPGDALLFRGDALLHTDWNNTNVLVDQGRARLVDWGWATRGAPWLDAAYWTIWLIAAGHAPADAEAWAARVPAWSRASSAALNVFAAASARLWSEITTNSTDAWTQTLAEAANAWASWRS
ncbi:hypothetical protein ACQP2F_32910 [Actinoplanes sp. CA-030573]|uniref:hypothetical protein n=1 Tax=Actinoplanes sp. CA-030573 TaxID=3239898 RepID=UPI003D948F18